MYLQHLIQGTSETTANSGHVASKKNDIRECQTTTVSAHIWAHTEPGTSVQLLTSVVDALNPPTSQTNSILFQAPEVKA